MNQNRDPLGICDQALSKEMALTHLCERTNYPMLQDNGQRCYGPPPDWSGPPPKKGCEIFIGRIPRDCYEDELVPLFETAGKIYMFRLMMDFSGTNRGYAFCMFTDKESSQLAVKTLNNYHIRSCRQLGVCLSIDNCSLFIGGIPKEKTKEEIILKMQSITEGVSDVVIYPGCKGVNRNCGFALVEYQTHKQAAMARRKLLPGRIFLWNHQISVNWAEPEKVTLNQIDNNNRLLFVRNVINSNERELSDYFNTTLDSFYKMKNELPMYRNSSNINNNTANTLPKAPIHHNKMTYSPIATSYVDKINRINETDYQVTMRNNYDIDLIIKLLDDTFYKGFKIFISYQSMEYLENHDLPTSDQSDNSPQILNAQEVILSNPLVKELSMFCSEHSLGEPVYEINVNLSKDKITGLKIPLYAVEIFISELNNSFQNTILSRNFDETLTRTVADLLKLLKASLKNTNH